VRVAVLWIAVCHMAFCPGPAATAFGQIMYLDFSALDPATQERVRAALVKLKESPGDISAVETILAIAPRVLETVGTNQYSSSSDPVQNQALKWIQSLQPAEVLVPCLEKGSNAAVYWALRQIVWRAGNDWFDKGSLARLMPGVEMALVKSPPATQAQAVRTMMVCLPEKDRAGFLKGLLKGHPDEVVAVAVEEIANALRQSDPDVEVIVAKWLKASDDPLLLRACCTYWWLVKSRSTLDVKEAEIAAFERVAGHPDATVRGHVALAVEAVATPGRPRLIGVLLRLTTDKDSSVRHEAVRALRNANTGEVNARLRELFRTGGETVRAAAIEVLGIFGKDNLPLILSAAKEDAYTGVRQNAVYALRHIGTPEAGKGLEAARRDSDKGVRDFAQSQFEWYRREHPSR
jgi:HEAT repeat protein